MAEYAHKFSKQGGQVVSHLGKAAKSKAIENKKTTSGRSYSKSDKQKHEKFNGLLKKHLGITNQSFEDLN